jgi:hypothetical protein
LREQALLIGGYVGGRRNLILTCALLLLSGCTGDEPKATPSVSPSPSVSASVSPTPSTSASSPAPAGRTAKLIVRAEYDKIWLYDVGANTEKVLLSRAGVRDARFESPSLITYSLESNERYYLRQVAISGAQDRVLFESPEPIQAYAWSPGRKAVAMITTRRSDDTMSLHVWRRGQGVSFIRRFGEQEGREFFDLDDISVRWSPDGERVLLNLSTLNDDADGRMFVIRRGQHVVPPRDAAQGIWVSNRRAVYMDWQAPNRWHSVDITTGTVRPLAITNRGHDASLSPDGSSIAYAAGEDIHVFTIATRSDRLVATKSMKPIWLSDSVLLYTKIKYCTSEDCAPEPIDYAHLDKTERVRVSSGRRSATALRNTLDVDVLWN